MKTVDADYAAEAMLALFKKKPWLTKPGTMADADAISEAEAVMFLRCMATEDVTSYGTTSPSAQRVACSLLLDFMAKVCTKSILYTKSAGLWINRDRYTFKRFR